MSSPIKHAAIYWASGVYTKLSCDPNLAGKPSYTTAVIAPDGSSFEGIFDGDGHTISNLTIDTAGVGNDYLGLFGSIYYSGSEIKNIGVENANITSGNNSHHLSGLCGYNFYGAINNSYATGFVTGDDYLGGLCGLKIYGAITYCFWDVETSGIGIEGGDNYGATGKTTVQMQTQSTFTDAGWDFVGETTNGTDDIWDICEGTNYPRLSWQFFAGDFTCPDGVNLIDFAVLAETWSLSSGQTGYNDLCDLIDDNTIDLNDLAVFAENWLCY